MEQRQLEQLEATWAGLRREAFNLLVNHFLTSVSVCQCLFMCCNLLGGRNQGSSKLSSCESWVNEQPSHSENASCQVFLFIWLVVCPSAGSKMTRSPHFTLLCQSLAHCQGTMAQPNNTVYVIHDSTVYSPHCVCPVFVTFTVKPCFAALRCRDFTYYCTIHFCTGWMLDQLQVFNADSK